MDTMQSTYSDTLYGKIKASHKLYAKKILCALFPDNSLSEFSILSKFQKKHSKIVKASLKDLEDCNLITNVNKSESPKSDKVYMLTSHGRQIVEKDNSLL